AARRDRALAHVLDAAAVRCVPGGFAGVRPPVRGGMGAPAARRRLVAVELDVRVRAASQCRIDRGTAHRRAAVAARARGISPRSPPARLHIRLAFGAAAVAAFVAALRTEMLVMPGLFVVYSWVLAAFGWWRSAPDRQQCLGLALAGLALAVGFVPV